MTLTIDRFAEFFEAANAPKSESEKKRSPFPWQTRLANLVFTSGWPQCIDLPTASGKTACIDIAVFVAACQAELPPQQRNVGRRIFFTVNRRVIVDEAFIRSKSLAEKLRDAEKTGEGILFEVARALRSLNEESDPSVAPPLAIAQLRGGVYRDASWARSLTQPIVICTTVDQLGSRMLFRGYGVSDQALPIHAALTTQDATILLDEAHVTKAFCETLGLLSTYQNAHSEEVAVAQPFQYVQLTATPQGEVDHKFQLQQEDLDNPVLNARQTASKPATPVPVDKKKSLAEQIAADAAKLGAEMPRAVGIIVNRVQTARDIAKLIKIKLSDEKEVCKVHLVIGRMRPIDRDRLQDALRDGVGPDRANVLNKTVYIVATQCLEVGADYDFDALLTECASIDALRQRFGRLNRAGRSIEAISNIYYQEPTEKGEDPIYGASLRETWNWLQLQSQGNKTVDFGIKTFNEMWNAVPAEGRSAMSSPTVPAVVLLPAHLNLLCQTSPRPQPEPDVSYFIHGPQRTSADVNVCWRADLGDDSSLWVDIVRLLPPTSLECMSVPIRDVRRWMAGQELDRLRNADVPVNDADEDPRKPVERKHTPKTVVRWRGIGDQSAIVSDPSAIRPGDTIVVRVEDGGWNELGHIPDRLGSSVCLDAETANTSDQSSTLSYIDAAEECYRVKNLRYVVRIHPAFPNRPVALLSAENDLKASISELIQQELPESQYAVLPEPLRTRMHNLRRAVLESARKSLLRHKYPGTDVTIETDAPEYPEVIYARTLLPKQTDLELPVPSSNDEEDDRSQSSHVVTLLAHTQHVVEQLQHAVSKLDRRLEPWCRLAAMWHDIGKVDVRFQAMLSGLTPTEIIEREIELAKSDASRLTQAERTALRKRSLLPNGFRHEFLSSQIVENCVQPRGEYATDWTVVLRLIESHHGFARPFAPVVIDREQSNGAGPTAIDFTEMRGVYLRSSDYWPEIDVAGEARSRITPAHQLNSGVTKRFWMLTRRFGWWGLAYLESIVRLADQRASAAEEMTLK